MKENLTEGRTNVTLSINNSLLAELKQDAAQKGLSMNAWSNEILKRYTFFYRHSENLECVLIPSRIYAMMLESMDERQGIEWLNKTINEIWPSLIIDRKVFQELEHFVDYAFGNIARLAGLCSTYRKYHDDEGCLCVLFGHKYGQKWSRMIGEAFSNSLVSLYRVEVERVIVSTSLLMRIRKK